MSKRASEETPLSPSSDTEDPEKTNDDEVLESENHRGVGEDLKTGELLERKYDAFEDHLREAATAGKRAFGFGSLSHLGLQEIISVFGVEKVSGALGSVLEAEDEKSFYKILRELEPNRKKRLELYNHMDILVDNEVVEAEAVMDSLSYDEMHMLEEFGATGNNARVRKYRIDGFRYLDKFSTLPLKIYDRIGSAITGHSPESDLAPYSLEEFIGTVRDFDVEKFRDDMKEKSGDLFALSSEYRLLANALYEKVRQEKVSLARDIENEIAKITKEVQNWLAEKKLGLMRDMDKVMVGNVTSEMSDMLEKLISSAEEQLATYEKEAERRLKKKTEGLQGMLYSVINSDPASYQL